MEWGEGETGVGIGFEIDSFVFNVCVWELCDLLWVLEIVSGMCLALGVRVLCELVWEKEVRMCLCTPFGNSEGG